MPWIDPYHADTTRDSHSSLELFRESPTLYAAQRLWGWQKQDSPSWEMLMGSALDCWLFEREQFGERYALSGTKCATTTKRESPDGRTFLTATETKLLADIEAGICSHPTAYEALIRSEGEAQKVLKWTDAETGLPLKAKMDRWLPGGRLIVDLKLTGDIREREWVRIAARFGYARQDAFYREGAEACGMDPQSFIFIVASREWPHGCAVYTLGEHIVEAGRRQNRELLRDLARRKAANDWDDRTSDEIQEINDFPQWALGSVFA